MQDPDGPRLLARAARRLARGREGNEVSDVSARWRGVSTLGCDHCGGDAVTSETDEYSEDMAAKCEECGFPGRVSIDDAGDDAEAYWSCSEADDAVCNDADCEECAEVRAAGGKGSE
jgi:hypothetical protein